MRIIKYILLSFLFTLLLFPGTLPISACSPSDFVLDDFAARCKDLAEKVRDTELAQRMRFPDAASRSALLLDAWLSFYLDHGVTPPPVYASMAGPAWENGMRSLGTTIGGLGRGEPVSPIALDLMTFPLELLAQPERLLPFQNALATVSFRLEEIVSGSASATSVSLPAHLAADPEIGRSLALVSELCESAPSLRTRLSTLYESLTAAQTDTPASSAPQLSDEDQSALLELHLGSLRDEVAFLSPIAFWQPQPAASPTSRP